QRPGCAYQGFHGRQRSGARRRRRHLRQGWPIRSCGCGHPYAQAGPYDRWRHGEMITRPKWLLHTEGAAIFAGSLAIYGIRGYKWWLFAALFLVPDIFMLGYLVDVKLGATLYNLVHTETLPVALGLAAILWRPGLLAVSLIWLAHIGMDRMLGFGLKYPTRFNDTHLARV